MSESTKHSFHASTLGGRKMAITVEERQGDNAADIEADLPSSLSEDIMLTRKPDEMPWIVFSLYLWGILFMSGTVGVLMLDMAELIDMSGYISAFNITTLALVLRVLIFAFPVMLLMGYLLDRRQRNAKLC